MRRWLSVLVASAALLVPGPARAEVTLTDVLSGLDRTPMVAAADEDRKAARGDRVAADGGFDAVVRARGVVVPQGYYDSRRADVSVEQPIAPLGASFVGGYRITRGPFAVYDGKLATNEGGEVRAGVSVPLLRNNSFDRRRANVERGRQGEVVAERTFDATKIDTVRQATNRYWEWVAAGRRAMIATRLLDLAVTRDEQLKARVARGDLPAFEREDNARAIQQRAAQVATANRALRGAALELSMFLRDAAGNPRVPEPNDLPETFPEPSTATSIPLADLVARALANRPELPRIRALQAQAEAEARVAAASRWPGLDLSVQVSRDLGQGAPERRPTEVEAVLSLELPVQNRAASGRETSARAAVAKAGHQARIVRDRVRIEVSDAVAAVEAARARVDAAREELRLARRVEEAEQKRLTLGEANILVVNQREQATFDAAVREVDALAERERALAALTAALGDDVRK